MAATPSPPSPEPTLRDVLNKLDQLGSDVDHLTSDIQQIRQDYAHLTSDVEASNARFDKWDSRLWGLTLGLIGTAWTAIFAASAVVITRILVG